MSYIKNTWSTGDVITAAKMNNIETGLETASDEAAYLKYMTGDAFSTDVAYTAGEYCIYDNTLYKFTNDKSAGEWNSGVVEETTIGDELSKVNSKSYTADKTVMIGTNPIDEITDTGSICSLSSTYINIGSTQAVVSNSYYDTTTGDDASITIKKDGIYSLYALVSASLNESTSQGNFVLNIYKDEEIIANQCIYTYSTYMCRINASRIIYLPAGSILTAKVKTSAATSGTMYYKDGSLTVTKLD